MLIVVNILLLSFENYICLCDHCVNFVVAMFMEAVYTYKSVKFAQWHQHSDIVTFKGYQKDKGLFC